MIPGDVASRRERRGRHRPVVLAIALISAVVSIRRRRPPLSPSSSSAASDGPNVPPIGRSGARRDSRRPPGPRRRRRSHDDEPLDEAEFIIRKSYAETYGRMPRCGDDAIGRDCIALAVEGMDPRRRGDEGGGSDSSTSAAFAAAGESLDRRPRFLVPDHHPYPWWFVTLLRDVARNGVYGPWHRLDTIATDPPLRFCAIGKNGCTEWRRVFRDLNAPEYCDGDNGGGHVVCEASKFNARAELGDDVPLTVFLRDPLERLLSGYLDKCAKPNIRASQGHCEPNEVFGVDHLRRKAINDKTEKKGGRRGSTTAGGVPLLPDLTAAVRDLEREMFATYVDLLPLKWNVHFAPQAFVCDLYRNIDKYDFVGIMGRDFVSELDLMADRYGGPLPDALDAAFGYRSKLENETRKFDNVGSDKAHGTKASAKVYRYYSPRAVRRALEYLSIDYVTLGLEVPAWAKEILREDEDPT
jgi:hypothetical protein